MKKAISLMLIFSLLAVALAACSRGTTTRTVTATEAPAQNTAEPEPTTGNSAAGSAADAVENAGDAVKDAGDAVGNAVDDAVDTPAENAEKKAGE